MGRAASKAVDQNSDLGVRVATFRQLHGLSLRALARAAGVSSSFLSLLENGRTNASVASLRKIAMALGVTPAQLLDEISDKTRGVLRSAERPSVQLDGAQKHVISMPPLRNVEVYSGTFAPGGSTGSAPFAHGNGQEFFIVLSGSVVFQLGDEEYSMSKNDSIEFLSSVPHAAVNVSTKPAEVMWICSPPTPVGEGASRPHAE